MVIKALGSIDILQTAPGCTTASTKNHCIAWALHEAILFLVLLYVYCYKDYTIINFYDYMLLTGHC